jgi:hypothetical protein
MGILLGNGKLLERIYKFKPIHGSKKDAQNYYIKGNELNRSAYRIQVK